MVLTHFLAPVVPIITGITLDFTFHIIIIIIIIIRRTLGCFHNRKRQKSKR
jgi:hydrogenase-4 membrane subunit HyfE